MLVDVSVTHGRTQTWTSPFGYPEVRRWIWIQEFYQDDSDRIQMSFENHWRQNIKREYKIFHCPHGENLDHTDALAVAMPPNTSTLEMLYNIASMNPILGGNQGTCI
jgi:hypothetical protein